MIPTKPIASFIIVNWNAKDYLVKCVKSVLSHSDGLDIEIIVVDNNSTDGSQASINTLFPNVLLLQQHENLGFSKANNIGIGHARGEFLFLINSDVVVLPNCISQLLSEIQTNSAIAMVAPRILGGDMQLQRSCRGFPNLWNYACRALALDSAFPQVKLFSGYSLSYWAQDQTRSVDILSGCFWCIRRAAIDKVGVLDERFFMYGEDMDWCKRFRASGFELLYVNSATSIHYGGMSSANAPVRFFVEMQKADIAYWRKHHSHVAFLSYLSLALLHHLLRLVPFAVLSIFPTPKRTVFRHKFHRSAAAMRWLILGR